MLTSSISVRKRLMTSFACVAILTILASALSISTFRNSQQLLDHITEDRLPFLTDVYQIAQQANSLAATVSGIAEANNEYERLRAVTRATEEARWLQDVLGRVRESQQDTRLVDYIDAEIVKTMERLNSLDNSVKQKIENSANIVDVIAKIYDNSSSLNTLFPKNKFVIDDKNTKYFFSVKDIESKAIHIVLLSYSINDESYLEKIRYDFENDVRIFMDSQKNHPENEIVNKKVENIIKSTFYFLDLKYKDIKIQNQINNMSIFLNKSFGRIVVYSNQLVGIASDKISEASTEFDKKVFFNSIVLIVICMSCIVGVIWFTHKLGNGIARRLERLRNAMRSASQSPAR